jgi:hypothetical protein
VCRVALPAVVLFMNLIAQKDSAAAAFHRGVSQDVEINGVEMTAEIGQNNWLINDILRKVAKIPIFNLSDCRFVTV